MTWVEPLARLCALRESVEAARDALRAAYGAERLAALPPAIWLGTQLNRNETAARAKADAEAAWARAAHDMRAFLALSGEQE